MIVTFYSFKGGVGRSMALANIARWFQLRGLNVVMVDWDLEAPGLETFFSTDDAVLRSWRDRVGLTDLLLLYKQDFPAIPFGADIERQEASVGSLPESPDMERPSAIAAPPPPPIRSPDERWAEIAADAARLRDLLPPLKFSLIDVPAPPNAVGAGRLRMLTAGWREGARFSAYANAVQSFDWNDFYESFHGHAYFEWLRGSLDDPEIADVVLIDSRTGVTEMGGVSTRQLADVVVVLMAPNNQNIDGAMKMTESFESSDLLEQRGHRPIRVIMVPSRIDVASTDNKKEFEAAFRDRANAVMPEELRALEHDFSNLRIPYVSKFAFRERLSIGERDGDPDLDLAYKAVAADVAWLAPSASRAKSLMVDEFVRVFGREQVRNALDFGAQFEQRWEQIPAHLQSDVRELLLRLVEVSLAPAATSQAKSTRSPAYAPQPDRPRLLLKQQLQGSFGEAVAAAQAAQLIVMVDAGDDGVSALGLAESEYVSRSPLTEWINEDREFLAWRQRLRVFLDDWQTKKRDPGSLLQGSAFLEAIELAEGARTNELLPDEREFISASIDAVRAASVKTPVYPPPPLASGPSDFTKMLGAPPPQPDPVRTGAVPSSAPTAIAPKRSSRVWVGAVAAGLIGVVALSMYLSSYGSVRTQPPPVGADSILAGRQLAANGDYGKAIVAYTSALRLDSRSVDARRFRAEALTASGRPDQALFDLDTAITIAPADAKLHAQRAQVRSIQQDPAGALDDLARIPVDSMDTATLRLRADLLTTQGQDSAALRAYTAVVQRGDTAAGQLGRGRVLERLGRNKEAVQAYRAATKTAADPSIVTFAQARLRVLAPGTPVTTAPTTVIYLQLASRADARLALAIDSSLKAISLHLERGASGQAYELVASAAKSPGEIRYFNATDEAIARRVQAAVEGALAANGIYQRLTTQFVRSSAQTSQTTRPSRSVEIWLPSLSDASRPPQSEPLKKP